MATMKTLPLNELEPRTFEYFCSEFLSQLKNLPFILRGINGEKQGGFDITTLDGKFKVECKKYEKLTLRYLRKFITDFKLSKYPDDSKLIFCFSCIFKRTKGIDAIIGKNKEEGLDIDIFDLARISSEIFNKKMFSLVYRYFDKNIFDDFFGALGNEYLAPDSVFIHYKDELKLKSVVDISSFVSDNLIKEGRVFSDEKIIKQVEVNLKKYRVCLIEAAEGRGKTVLSQIISYQKYHDQKENHDVFFLDLKSNPSLNNIKKHLNLLASEPNLFTQQYLVVFENAHGYSDLNDLMNELKGLIESGMNDKSGHNLYFLINSRILDKHDPFKDWAKHFTVSLAPGENDINQIINIYQNYAEINYPGRKFIDELKLDLFIKNKVFYAKAKAKQRTNGANLRLLYLYFGAWKANSDKTKTLDEIGEDDVIYAFSTKYLQRKLDNNINILLKLALIFQFDVPLFVPENENDVRSYLHEKMSEGLLQWHKSFFYLAHALDAKYLAKAICIRLYKDYHEETAKEVLSYVDFMIKNSELFPEIHFSQIIIELIERKSENKHFVDILDELWDISPEGKAKEILTNLNMGFLFMILRNHPDMNTKRAEILKFYTDNKQNFKNRLLKINPFILALINSTLIAAYNYKNLARDIFSTPADLDSWLKQLNTGGGYIIKLLTSISEIDSNYAFAVYDYRFNKPKKNKNNIKDYYFNSDCIDQKSLKVNKKFIRKFENDAVNKENLIDKLNGAKICFADVSWAALARLFGHIVDFYKIRTNDDDKPAQNVAKKLFDEILFNHDSFNFVTDNELSSILDDLQVIDSNYYYYILKELPIINCMKSKLQDFGYSEDEKMLLKHFINSEFLKEQIDNIFSKADENQKAELKMHFDAEQAQ